MNGVRQFCGTQYPKFPALWHLFYLIIFQNKLVFFLCEIKLKATYIYNIYKIRKHGDQVLRISQEFPEGGLAMSPSGAESLLKITSPGGGRGIFPIAPLSFHIQIFSKFHVTKYVKIIFLNIKKKSDMKIHRNCGLMEKQQ